MINKEGMNDWIDRYNEGSLGIRERSLFERQMDADPLLRAEVKLDQRLDGFLAEKEMIDLLNKICQVRNRHARPVLRNRFLLLAAAVLCLVTLAFVIALHVRHERLQQIAMTKLRAVPHGLVIADREHPAAGRKPPETANTRPGTEKTIGSDLLAARFKPMPELELLVGTVTRSMLITVTSPAPVTSIRSGKPVQFAWSRTGGKRPVVVVVVNNMGVTVWESATTDSVGIKFLTRGFAPGLYYWKIIFNDELVTMGKMAIH